MEELSCRHQELHLVLRDVKYSTLITCVDVWYPIYSESLFNDVFENIVLKYKEVLGLSDLFKSKYECVQKTGQLDMVSYNFKHGILYTNYIDFNVIDNYIKNKNIQKEEKQKFRDSIVGIGCFVTYVSMLNIVILQHVFVLDIKQINLTDNLNIKKAKRMYLTTEIARTVLCNIAKELNEKLHPKFE